MTTALEKLGQFHEEAQTECREAELHMRTVLQMRFSRDSNNIEGLPPESAYFRAQDEAEARLKRAKARLEEARAKFGTTERLALAVERAERCEK